MYATDEVAANEVVSYKLFPEMVQDVVFAARLIPFEAIVRLRKS